VRRGAQVASPGRGSGTSLYDCRSLSKPRLKLGAGHTWWGPLSHGPVAWSCLPISPAQKISLGPCCLLPPSLKDFQQGNKKVFLCWANIYITNIWCLCLVTNISACKWEAFLRKGGTGKHRGYSLLSLYLLRKILRNYPSEPRERY